MGDLVDHGIRDVRPNEGSSDLSAAFGIAIGLALAVLLQLGLFVGLHSLWQRFFS